MSAVASLSSRHLAAGAVLGVVGLAVCLGVAAWARGALITLLFLIPFHRLAVAVVDHAGWPVDRPPSGDTLHEFLARSYWLDVSVLAGLLAGALLAAARRRMVRIGPRWLVGLLAVVVVGIPALAVVLGVDVPRAATFSVMLTLSGPIAFLAALWIGPTKRTASGMRWAFVLAAAVLGAVALVEQRITTGLPLWLGGEVPHPNSAFFSAAHSSGYRSGSLLRTPLELGFFMAAAVPLAVAATLAARRARPLAAGAAGLVFAGLAVTYTRSGYLGAVAGVLVIAWALLPARQLRRLLPAAAAAAAVATTLVAAAGAGGVHLTRHDTSAHLGAVGGDIELVRQRPLGHGFGIIDTVGQQFDPRVLPKRRSSEDLWMAKAVEGGVEGATLYATGVAAVGVALVLAARAGRRRGDRGLVLDAAGPLASLSAIAVAGIFLGIEDVSYLVPVWALAGPAVARGLPTRPASDAAAASA